MIWLNVNALTLEDNSTLYNAIARQLGDTIADALATNVKFGNAKELFNQIINQALEKVANGDFALMFSSAQLGSQVSLGSALKVSDTAKPVLDSSTGNIFDSRLTTLGSLAIGDYININALINWVVEQLALNLGEIMPNGYADMPIENLNELYKNQYDLAMDLADDDSDKAAQMIKDAAINYCQALADKGDSYLSAIKSVFGSLDYESVISELINDGDIFSVNNLINNLVDKVSEIEEVGDSVVIDDTNVSWNEDFKDMSLTTGTTKEFNIGTVNGDSSKVSYQASTTNNRVSVSIDGNGGVTITTGDNVGPCSVSVDVLVDGEVIASKTITVTVKKVDYQSIIDGLDETADWGQDASCEHVEAFTSRGSWNDNITAHSFADLYNNDTTLVLSRNIRKKNGYADGDNAWNECRDVITERLTNVGNLVVTALASAGLDKAVLEKAMKSVVEQYTSETPYYITKNDGGNNEKNFMPKVYDAMKNDRENTTGKIVGVKDFNGGMNVSDSVAFAIHFKDFVDDILAAYESLGGTF